MIDLLELSSVARWSLTSSRPMDQDGSGFRTPLYQYSECIIFGLPFEKRNTQDSSKMNTHPVELPVDKL